MIAEPTDTTDLVRMYLRDIGRVPLLTPEQELAYGTQVQRMMSLLEAKETLAQVLHREPTEQEWASHVRMSEAELTAIVRCGQRAKQKMVSACPAPGGCDCQEVPEAEYGVFGFDPGRNTGIAARRREVRPQQRI